MSLKKKKTQGSKIEKEREIWKDYKIISYCEIAVTVIF